LKADHSTSGPAFRGGILVLRNIAAVIPSTSITRPSALTVQAKPIFGSSCWTIAGITIPPVVAPVAAIPIANERFFAKYVLNKLIVGTNCKPLPIPWQTPCARNICQYLVHKLVMKTPRSCKTSPLIKTGRKYPASVARPASGPRIKSKKICTLPIHEMVDTGS
jgi:hypothetical protein